MITLVVDKSRLFTGVVVKLLNQYEPKTSGQKGFRSSAYLEWSERNARSIG